MLPDEISTLFSKVLRKFDAITCHTTDSHLAEFRELLSQNLLVIPYDKEIGIHKLVRLINEPTTYMSDYSSASPCYINTAIYNTLICIHELALVRAPKEVICRAWRSDFTIFEAAEREDGKFILSVVKDTWV